MSCPCTRSKCQKEWDSLYDPEKNYDDEYAVVHCDMPKCHEIYLRNKNGNVCVECGDNACELCVSLEGYFDTEDDEWYCTPCAVELKKMNKSEAFPCPCKRKECLEEWEEYDNGDGASHCETKDCHSIYWNFKNGGWCSNTDCNAKACEGCMSDTGCYGENEYKDAWYCEKCKPNVKSIIKKSKAKSDALQLQYILTHLTNKRKLDEANKNVDDDTETMEKIKRLKAVNK